MAGVMVAALRVGASDPDNGDAMLRISPCSLSTAYGRARLFGMPQSSTRGPPPPHSGNLRWHAAACGGVQRHSWSDFNPFPWTRIVSLVGKNEHIMFLVSNNVSTFPHFSCTTFANDFLQQLVESKLGR